MAQWAEPVLSINNKSSTAADNQQINNITSNEQEADEALKQPLLDSGQGESNGNNNNKLLHP
jgi:hypothetical protein